MFDGLLGRTEVHQPVFEVHTACCTGTNAEDGLQQLGTAGAHQAVQAEDLAFSYIKGDVLQMGGILGGQVLHGQNGVARSVVHGGEAAFQRAAHHGGDQLVHVGLLGGLGHDQVAVPEHGDLITDLKDLIHLVGDIDECDPLLLQHPHHLEELVDLLHGQGGGGLVQNDDLGVIGDSLGDLTHLPLRNRHVPHGLRQVDGHAQLTEQLGSFLLHSAFVYHTGVGGVAAQEQVVNDVPLQALVELLVDHGDPVFQSILGAGKADFLAV